MATQIFKTVAELQALSNGKSCPQVIDYLNTNYPGWDQTTSIDVLPYCEGLRSIGKSELALWGLVNYLTDAQRDAYLTLLLGKIPSALAKHPKLKTAYDTIHARIGATRVFDGGDQDAYYLLAYINKKVRGVSEETTFSQILTYLEGVVGLT